MGFSRLLATFLFPTLCLAQESKYPTDYFRNPLDIPILLAGNFGECRSGHFHSGLDIKTMGKEDLPVYAAADGYISRIKTEKGGFGHAIYITHPNGYTTLYAHLNHFAPFLQTYLREQQYLRKRWDLDISFPAEKFPVIKGQQIAWSGNTGGSTAPHLHFEIRDNKTEHPLNPQLFGLQVNDKTPPVAREIVLYSGNVYDRQLASYSLAKRGNIYRPVRSGNAHYKVTGDTIDAPGDVIGIGINADDYMEGSDNTITFYTARLYADDELQSEVTLDDIGYDVSRYIHAYTDYYSKEKFNKWIQCLFKLPGNKLGSIYTQLNDRDGRVTLGGAARTMRLVLTDPAGNESIVAFVVRPGVATEPAERETDCTPFAAASSNKFETTNVRFTLDDRELYDDICFTSEAVPGKGISNRVRIHYPYIPLHHYFELALKPNKTIPISLRDKVVLMYSDGKDEDGRDAKFTSQGWYEAKVRNFGTYWLAIDTVAPSIKSAVKNNANLSKATRLTLTAKDEMTSVKSFEGILDGKWVCFEQHGTSFFYEFDEHCTPGKHTLVFRASDENGNEAKFKMQFTK